MMPYPASGFARFSKWTARATGHPMAFASAILVIVDLGELTVEEPGHEGEVRRACADGARRAAKGQGRHRDPRAPTGMSGAGQAGAAGRTVLH